MPLWEGAGHGLIYILPYTKGTVTNSTAAVQMHTFKKSLQHLEESSSLKQTALTESYKMLQAMHDLSRLPPGNKKQRNHFDLGPCEKISSGPPRQAKVSSSYRKQPTM